MKRYSYLLCIFVLLSLSSSLNAQMLLPRPDPPRAVNDFANLLSPSEAQALEDKLRVFTDTTSNAIVIVIVDDLQGYDRSEFAFKLGNDWGVGQANNNNGIIVLVKTKSVNSNGLAFIATGKGLEGAIPDLACADIVDREMLPRFREDDYYGGLDAATNVLMSLASGEYNYDLYKKDSGGKAEAIPAGLILIIILIVIALTASGNSNNKHIKKNSTSGLPFWILMSMLGSGKSHGGSWGGFSGGGGGFGGSGGGGSFGGFGGGGFGGGGAGGSW